MSSVILTMVGSVVLFLLYLALAAILIRKFKATGDVGFVWLAVATVLWPILVNLIGGQIMRYSTNVHPAKAAAAVSTSYGALHPPSLLLTSFDLAQKAVGVVLMIVAVLALSSQLEKRAADGTASS
jgi:hypothetical protein